jgi:predicted phosphodiesterase
MTARTPNGPFRSISLLLAGVLALVLASAAGAESLYERSLPRFKTLAEKAAPQEFTFVVLGDNRGNDAVFRRALRLAAGYAPLFILHDGDVSESGSRAELDHFRAVVEESVPAIPFFVVAGNHEGKKDIFVRELAPLDYVIDSPRLGLRVAVVDNSGYALKPGELAFLDGKLTPERHFTFIAMHIPPKTPRWSWHTFSEGADGLTRLLAEKKPTAVFFGHVHLFDQSEIAGVPAFITGGAGAPLVLFGFPGEPVYHILVVRVKNGVASFEMVRVPENGGK